MAVKLLKAVRRIPLVIIGITVALFVAVGFLLCLIKIDTTVRVSGVIMPEDVTEVRTESGGLITKIYVKQKQYVEKEELLAELDDTYTLLRLAQAQSSLKLAEAEKIQARYRFREQQQAVKSARIKMEKAKEELGVAQKAYQLKIISLANLKTRKLAYSLALSDYEQSKIQLDLAKSEVTIKGLEPLLTDIKAGEEVSETISISEEQAKRTAVDIDMLKEELKKKKIYAPISGLILTPNIEVLQGTYIAPGGRLLTMGNLDRMIMRGRISEKKSLEVKPGQKVNIFVKTYPYREYKIFEGEVLSIGVTFTSLTEAVVVAKEKEHLPATFTTIDIRIIDPIVKVGDEIRTLQTGFTAEAEIIIKSMSLFDMLKKFIGKTGTKFENLSIHF